MPAGNFVAVLAMTLAIWCAFAILGSPWEGERARLVVLGAPQVSLETTLDARLPDSMRVSSIRTTGLD